MFRMAPAPAPAYGISSGELFSETRSVRACGANPHPVTVLLRVFELRRPNLACARKVSR